MKMLQVNVFRTRVSDAVPYTFNPRKIEAVAYDTEGRGVIVIGKRTWNTAHTYEDLVDEWMLALGVEE